MERPFREVRICASMFAESSWNAAVKIATPTNNHRPQQVREYVAVIITIRTASPVTSDGVTQGTDTIDETTD